MGRRSGCRSLAPVPHLRLTRLNASVKKKEEPSVRSALEPACASHPDMADIHHALAFTIYSHLAQTHKDTNRNKDLNPNE